MRPLKLPYGIFKDNKHVSCYIQSGVTDAFWARFEQELSHNQLKGFALAIDLRNDAQNFSNIVNMPFWQHLEELHLNGEIENSCFQTILNKLPNQTALTHLSLCSADLPPLDGEYIIANLPPAVKSLNLSNNLIKEYQLAPEDYGNFCQAIQNSHLKALTLGMIGPKECATLSKYIRETNRFFKLTLLPEKTLLDEHLTPLIDAMSENRYLTIEIHNIHKVLNEEKNLLLLRKQSEINRVPRLQELTALQLCEHLTSLLIEDTQDSITKAQEITSAIPLNFISSFPLNKMLRNKLFADNSFESKEKLANTDAANKTPNRPH